MQGLLLMNTNAAATRVMNLAKAEALMRVQDLQSAPWFPLDEPPVEPTNLGLGTHVETVDIGESASGVGSISAQVSTVVESIPNEFGTDIRRLTVEVAYNYVGQRHELSVFTMRAPDKLTAAEQE